MVSFASCLFLVRTDGHDRPLLCRLASSNLSLTLTDRGHFLVVGFFVSSHKVDINRCNANASGHTPLILAVYSDHLSVVNTLVYHGVDLALSDSEEKSPFWWACCKSIAFLTHHKYSLVLQFPSLILTPPPFS